MGNWCADFALDFYIDGTRIHFIDLSTDGSVALEADIEKIVKITSPNNTLGATLNSNTNYAIGSFTESADIGETYEQRLITFKVKPKKVKKGLRRKEPLWLSCNASSRLAESKHDSGGLPKHVW